MGTEGLRGRLPLRDDSLIFYAGLVAQRPRSATSLRGILRDYFESPVEIEQCLGSWYVLGEQDRCYMDRDGDHNRLGMGAVVGDEVWDQQARFRVRMGPLPFARFRKFLPDGDALDLLVAWVRFFAGPVLAFDVNIGLNRGEVPPLQLGDDSAKPARLGWQSWLKTDPFNADAFDVEFSFAS
jgi:type VI secretion system protein ImpH